MAQWGALKGCCLDRNPQASLDSEHPPNFSGLANAARELIQCKHARSFLSGTLPEALQAHRCQPPTPKTCLAAPALKRSRPSQVPPPGLALAWPRRTVDQGGRRCGETRRAAPVDKEPGSSCPGAWGGLVASRLFPFCTQKLLVCACICRCMHVRAFVCVYTCVSACAQGMGGPGGLLLENKHPPTTGVAT